VEPHHEASHEAWSEAMDTFLFLHGQKGDLPGIQLNREKQKFSLSA